MCVCLFVCLSSYLASYLSIYGPPIKKVCHFIGSVEHELKDWLYHIYRTIYIYTHVCTLHRLIISWINVGNAINLPWLGMVMTGDIFGARCTIQNVGQIPMIQGKSHQKSPFFLSALYSHCLANIFNGHFRNLNWRYLPYIFGLFFRPM